MRAAIASRAGVRRGGVAGGADHQDRRRCRAPARRRACRPWPAWACRRTPRSPTRRPTAAAAPGSRSTSASSLRGRRRPSARVGRRSRSPSWPRPARVRAVGRAPEVLVGELRAAAPRVRRATAWRERVGEDRPPARAVVEHREHRGLEQARRERRRRGSRRCSCTSPAAAAASTRAMSCVSTSRGAPDGAQRAPGLLAPVEERRRARP